MLFRVVMPKRRMTLKELHGADREGDALKLLFSMVEGDLVELVAHKTLGGFIIDAFHRMVMPEREGLLPTYTALDVRISSSPVEKALLFATREAGTIAVAVEDTLLDKLRDFLE